MKSSIFAGVLLLSAALVSVDGQSWAAFQRKHVNAGMTHIKCTEVIKARTIVDPPNRCKVINTFITYDVNAVLAVCAGGGTPYGNGYTISNATFPIIDCTQQNQNQVPPVVPPNCLYNGTASTKRIIVRCENKKPVHFHGSQ
ncbi:ribonuclease pancreatic-like [Etheostoma cragini]|uniref:ribonuclease pancreatic-like n=1 Tax=Etheostoma cragini TaxID=417921 RepID=UPI00155E754C|nr:ribonuclease pancreatic-like [Etheostoma cragini]